MDIIKDNFRARSAEIMFIIAIVAVIAVTAPEKERSSAECYTSIKSCQGLNIGGCIGQEKTEVQYKPKSQCSVVENITSECKTLRTAICGSEKINSSNWMEKAETYGKTCKTWKSEYKLNYSETC